jgi:Gpi18-like mannosyltransferase
MNLIFLLKARFSSNRDYSWFWQDIFFPLLITRVVLELTGWFSQALPRDPHYGLKDVIERGWHFTPNRLLDIWGRWDSGWYMDVIQNGYRVIGDMYTVESNVVRFPLYPFLVKTFSFCIPEQYRTTSAILLIGVVLSNAFLLGALVWIYRLVNFMYEDKHIASRTVWYLLLFPTSFFLSCFYTEALFLLLAVGAFDFAVRQRWLLASVLVGLLTLTRPQGIFLTAPLVWMYMETKDWKVKNISYDALSFFVVPVIFSSFLLYMYRTYAKYISIDM